jgi:hypothetical protein
MSVCHAIEVECALASAPIPRQFNGLILKPAKDALPHCAHPLMIVIDSLDTLDEKCNYDLLWILKNSAALVPDKFQFFITNWSKAVIILPLCNLEHVSLKEIDINPNCQDVGIFVSHCLNNIARDCSIKNWLNDKLITRFNCHAEGLFIWAVTVCNHVSASGSPEEELGDVLSNQDLLDDCATEKMNKLYASILSKCPWDDRHFAHHYQSSLGAVIVLKQPLLILSIEKLLDNSKAHSVSCTVLTAHWCTPLFVTLSLDVVRLETM